jgi:hypothetical protein
VAAGAVRTLDAVVSHITQEAGPGAAWFYLADRAPSGSDEIDRSVTGGYRVRRDKAPSAGNG